MRRSSRLVCSVGLAIGFLQVSALAAPPVMDHIPGNAVAVISTPSLGKLHDNADAFIKSIDLPLPIPFPDVSEILGEIGIQENKGLDPKNMSFAFAFIPPPAKADAKADANADAPAQPDPEQMIVIVVQTTNAADFLSNFEAKPAGADGIITGAIQGEDAFFRDLGGGFVAMAPSKETLERADWKADPAIHSAAIGAPGKAVLDSADLSIVVFTDQARQFVPELQKAIDDKMSQGPAGAAFGQIESMPFVNAFSKAVTEDSTASVTGIRLDSQGLAIDTAMSFKADSEAAKALSGVTGSSNELLSKLPTQPYYFAMALDTSAPGVRKLIDEHLAQMGDAANAGIPGFLANWVRNSEGAAMCIGAPPGGLMGGLFTSTVGFVRTRDADAFVQNMKQGLASLNGKAAQGQVMETSYEAESVEVDGRKVDSWGIKIKPDENSDEDMGQLAFALPIIFGQAKGPAGFVSRVDGGIIQTFEQNQPLMASALKAAQGGENLGSDKLLAKVSEMLPPHRVAEFYVGVKSILEAAVPLMATQNINVDVELPNTLPPIGIGMSGEQNGTRIGVYLPAPTLKAVTAVGQQVMAAQKGEDGAPHDADGVGKKNGGKEKGAGQPRF